MVRIYGVTTTTSGSGSDGAGNVPSIILGGITLSNSTVYLTSDSSGTENSSNIIIIPPNTSALFSAHIIASYPASSLKSASWTLTGLAKKNSDNSSISIINISPVTIASDPEMELSQIELSENSILGGISIKCSGILGYTLIKWAATITLTEV